MGDVGTVRLHYVGMPAFGSMVAQTLTDQGVEVSWERPVERRGLEEIADAVAVELICTGVITAIHAGVKKARQRLGQRGTIEVGDDEDSDQTGDES